MLGEAGVYQLFGRVVQRGGEIINRFGVLFAVLELLWKLGRIIARQENLRHLSNSKI